METKYQYFRSHSSLVRLKVTQNPTSGLCYIFWGDLRVAFPGIARVQDGDVFVPFMRCYREYRLKPFRIEYIPDSVLDIVYKDEANPDIKLKAALRASKRKTKEPHGLGVKEREYHQISSETEQDLKDNIGCPLAEPLSIGQQQQLTESTSEAPVSLPFVVEFDPSLPSPSLSPSPSPSPLPRTPDSFAAELLEQRDDNPSTNSSINIDLVATLNTLGSTNETAAAGQTSHESSDLTIQTSSESRSGTAIPSEASSLPIATVGAPAKPSSPSIAQSLRMENSTTSNESKLNTVMSLVKGLSLQVAGSAVHKEVHEAAAKHSVTLSNIETILPGTGRVVDAGVFSGSVMYSVAEANLMGQRELALAKASQTAAKYPELCTAQVSDGASKKEAIDRSTLDAIESGKVESLQDNQKSESRRQAHPSRQKKQQKSLSKQKPQNQNQQQASISPQSTVVSKPAQEKPSVVNATLTTSKAQAQAAPMVNPYSLLTNAMPLLLQSGLFSEYTGSLTASNDTRANALVDVITSYKETEDLVAFNRMNYRYQRTPLRQGSEKVANEKDGAATAIPSNKSNVDEWTEIGQLLKVFTQAAAKGNLRVGDRMGLQLERKLYDLEKRIVTQPELKSKVQSVSDSFWESQQKLTPLRNARIQMRARTLVEQRLALTENIVPNMFVILPVSLETNPVQLRLYFLCQCQGDPRCNAHVDKGEEMALEGEEKPAALPSHFGHLTNHPGYDLVFDQQLVLVCGLYMFDLLEIMKYGVTLEDVYVEQDDDDDEDGENEDTGCNSMLRTNDRRKLKTITIPPLNPHGSRSEAELYHRVNYALVHIMSGRCVESSPDSLKAFLKGLTQEINLPSRDESLGGMIRVLSSQGSARWLCEYHYNALHRAPRMSAFVRLIEGQKAVPIFWECHLGQVQVLFPSRKELRVFLNILKTLRAPIQDLTLMLDWPLSALDLQQLQQSLHAFAVNIPSIRICLGKGSIPEEAEVFKKAQLGLIASMVARREVHLFLLEDARPLQDEWDASTRLFANHKELNFDNWERYPNTRAVVVKDSSGYIKLSIVVESTKAGLELVKRYFGGENKSSVLMGLQLYANKHDAVKYEFKDGIMTDICLSATSSSPKKLLNVSNIELLQFKVLTKQDRNEFESILKRNSTICEVEVHCSMEIMPEIFTLLKKWRRGHSRPPSVRIEHEETKLWWVQELFNCGPPTLELSVQDPIGLGPILEMVAPELRTFEGPLLDSQAAIFLNVVRKRGCNLTELDLDISYFTPAGFDSISKVVEMSRLEMLGIMVSSRTPACIQQEALVQHQGGPQNLAIISPTMDWGRIAYFIMRVRNVSRSLQFIGADVNEILHNLQPRVDLAQLAALKKIEIYGGKSVSLDPTIGLPMIVSMLNKVALWTVKFVDIRIDPDSWVEILGAINYHRLIWLDIRQSGFGPEQMACLVEKIPKKSTLKKLYIRMGARPTNKQLQQWRAGLAKKTMNLNFLCEMDERAPNEIGMRVRDIRF
ncbi:hypothetical protein BGX27_007881 [Mortierella sp. AM989]|nr:hypothetical protein BGX27_007881 [Mortierella sp. AM989]